MISSDNIWSVDQNVWHFGECEDMEQICKKKIVFIKCRLESHDIRCSCTDSASDDSRIKTDKRNSYPKGKMLEKVENYPGILFFYYKSGGYTQENMRRESSNSSDEMTDQRDEDVGMTSVRSPRGGCIGRTIIRSPRGGCARENKGRCESSSSDNEITDQQRDEDVGMTNIKRSRSPRQDLRGEIDSLLSEYSLLKDKMKELEERLALVMSKLPEPDENPPRNINAMLK
jgi:hypothetical protein